MNISFFALLTVFSSVGVVFSYSNDTIVDHHWVKFQSFVGKFERKYSNIRELIERFEIFKDNLHYIETENSKNYK